MKIMWTIAALACSVTLVNAQQSPRRPTPTAKPAAPAPRPRVEIAEPWVTPAPIALPSIETSLELTSLTMLAPGQMVLEPMTMALELVSPRPGQSPMALESLVMVRPGQGGGITPFPPLPALEPLPPLEPLAPLTPLPPLEPLAPLSPQAPLAPLTPLAPLEPLVPLTPLPPLAPAAPMIFDFLPGPQGPTPRPSQSDRQWEAELRRLTSELDRAEQAQRRALEAQDRAAQREVEAQLRNLTREIEQAERNRAMQDRQLQREIDTQVQQSQREQERMVAQAVREAELQNRQMQREAELALRHAQMDMTHSMNFRGDFNVTVPSGWAKQDVADSVWNRARELLNRGEWGEAVSAFRSIPQRYPNSAYAAQAAYYQAFGLFRIGGTSELREALQVLDGARTRYPTQSREQIASLATRIRGVLANRGDVEAARVLRESATEQGATCDREEQSVQAEAMNQLSRLEGSNINELITRVLARKDDCAIPLRRTAVFLVGNRRDAQAVTILAGVARNDPSVDVKAEATAVIGRLPNEEGVPVLEELVRSDDERIQRAAIRALVRHQSARAKTSVRSLVEREDISERVRSEALSAFDSERATADDIAWLRALYGRMTTPSLKARTLGAIVRVGGPEVDQWLVTIARDDAQPSEIRATAMRRIGETMSVADLGRLYDGATNRRFRSEVINVLGKRKEDAATDKLIDIVKNGTDPQLRSSAIQAITEKGKTDARALQALLEIINKTPSRGE